MKKLALITFLAGITSASMASTVLADVNINLPQSSRGYPFMIEFKGPGTREHLTITANLALNGTGYINCKYSLASRALNSQKQTTTLSSRLINPDADMRIGTFSPSTDRESPGFKLYTDEHGHIRGSIKYQAIGDSSNLYLRCTAKDDSTASF